MAVSMTMGRDTKWLTLEVCREFQRGTCSRSDAECKFAHPSRSCHVENGRVIACFDSLKVTTPRRQPLASRRARGCPPTSSAAAKKNAKMISLCFKASFVVGVSAVCHLFFPVNETRHFKLNLNNEANFKRKLFTFRVSIFQKCFRLLKLDISDFLL